MKASFVVKFAIELWLKTKGIGGPLNAFLTFVLCRILGAMLDQGIIKLDLTLDSLSQALKDKRWQKDARLLWDEATQGGLSEEEKQLIREKYLAVLGDFVIVNHRELSDDKDSQHPFLSGNTF